MLSKNKMLLLLTLGCVSLVGTGFSSWIVKSNEAGIAKGNIVVSIVKNCEWIKSGTYSNPNTQQGLNIYYSIRRGFISFKNPNNNMVKDYFNFVIDIDKAKYLEACYNDPTRMKLDFSLSITDSRFLIDKVTFTERSAYGSFLCTNTADSSSYVFSIMADDGTTKQDFNSIINKTAPTVNNIQIELKVSVKAASNQNWTGFDGNVGLTYRIVGGVI